MVDKSADNKLDLYFNWSQYSQILTRISLCHSGFKGLAISSVRGIVTFNNWQSYCLDSSWTLAFSHPLDLFSSFSSPRGEINGNSWDSGKFGQFTEYFMSNTCSRYPSYPSQGYPSDANSNKETKKVWTLQPKPSSARGAAWGAAQARCSSAALPSDYVTPPVALVQQRHRVAAGCEQHTTRAVGKLSSISLACGLHNKQTLSLTSVRSSVRTSVKPQLTPQSRNLSIYTFYSLLLLTRTLLHLVWLKTTWWNTPLYNLTKNMNTFTFFWVEISSWCI